MTNQDGMRSAPFELESRLKKLDVKTEFWRDRDPTFLELSAEKRLEIAKQWDAYVGEGEFKAATELSIEAGIGWECGLYVSFGDTLLRLGHVKESLDAYRTSIDEAPRPSIQAESAFLLAIRARVSPTPLSEFDLENAQEELISEPMLEAPDTPQQVRGDIFKLALEGYGRVYGHNLYWASADHPNEYIDIWLQLLVLDGLRTLFLTAGWLDLAELACDSYTDWIRWMFEDYFDYQDAHRFERNFTETRGYLKGRRDQALRPHIKLAESSVRTDTSDRELSLEELDAVLRSREKRIPAMAEDNLQVELGEAWQSLASDVRHYISAAEEAYLRQQFARDLSGVGTQFRKAVERLLVELEGRPYRGIIGDYGDVTQLKLGKVLRAGAPVKELTEKIREFSSEYGNPPAHVRSRYQPFHPSLMREGRRRALEIIREIIRWLKY